MEERQRIGRRFARAVAVALATATLATVTAQDKSPSVTTRLVSIVIGCLEVPAGARVVITEDFRDAWIGYLELPGDPRRISWANGLVVSSLKVTEGRRILWRRQIADSGGALESAAVDEGGKRRFVVRNGMVEFSLAGDGESELQYLLSVARRLRATVSTSSCEPPELEIRKQAF